MNVTKEIKKQKAIELMQQLPLSSHRILVAFVYFQKIPYLSPIIRYTALFSLFFISLFYYADDRFTTIHIVCMPYYPKPRHNF